MTDGRRRGTGMLLLALIAWTACSGPAGDPIVTSEAAAGASGSQATITSTTAAAPAGRVFLGADGFESTITDTSRIVTLSGDLTETVWLLGFASSVVATDVTTVFPPEAIALPVVGVGRFLTAEGVLAQSPTLVIGDTQTSPPEVIAQIRGAGIPVVILEVPTSFEGLYSKIRALAEVLGVPDRGDVLAAKLESEIEDVLRLAEPFADKPGVAFVYSRGPDVMLLFGAGMTTQPLIEAAGAGDVGTESGVVRTVSVTPEALVAAAPDVIVITSEGLDALGGIDGLLAIPGFAETPAGRDGRILDYPEGDILTFGPRIAQSLELLITDLRSILGES